MGKQQGLKPSNNGLTTYKGATLNYGKQCFKVRKLVNAMKRSLVNTGEALDIHVRTLRSSNTDKIQ